MIRIGFYLMGLKGFECLQSVSDLCKNNKNFQISFVVCAKDQNVVKDYFDEIKTFSFDEDIDFVERQKDNIKKESDLDFAISWRWIIKKDVEKLIVFHDSILPKLRGFNPLVTALIEGNQEIGVTALRANKDFDKGNILGLNKISINYPLKISNAIEIVSGLYSNLILEIIQKAHDNTLEEQIQDDKKATYSLWRDEEDYQIDWSESSDKIVRTIDALGFPYLGASTIYNTQKIRILSASIIEDLEIINRCSGKILFINNNKPVIVCGKGLLQIETAQYEREQTEVIFDKLRIRLL